MTFAKWTRPHGPDDAETWSETETAPTLNGWEERHEVSPVLISSTVGSPARTSAWPVDGPVFGVSAAVCGLNSSGYCPSCGHPGHSSRMFPDSLAPTTDATSIEYFWGWRSSGMASPGAYWTRDSSESPSGAGACSLSAVLETRSVPRKYWLSAKAAAGILRRAAKRQKTLPPRLMTALVGLASTCR